MRSRNVWTLLAILVLFPVAAAAGSGSFVTTLDGDDVEKFDLAELRDGETRTFGEGEDAIEVSRSGDAITIRTRDGDGKPLVCTIGKSSCYVYAIGDDAPGTVLFLGEDGSAHELSGHDYHWVHTGDDDSDGTFVFQGRPDATIKLRNKENGGDHAVKIVELSGSPDVVTYECPEGDTTMRLQQQDDGPYFCPKHGSALERSERSGQRREVKIIKFRSEEGPHAHE